MVVEEKLEYSEKTYATVLVATASLIWAHLGWNLGHHEVEPATNFKNYKEMFPVLFWN
jgi:hypothetical protein